MVLVQLEEQDWQTLLKTTQFLVFIGTKCNHARFIPLPPTRLLSQLLPSWQVISTWRREGQVETQMNGITQNVCLFLPLHYLHAHKRI
jgi:hypothetical protein